MNTRMSSQQGGAPSDDKTDDVGSDRLEQFVDQHPGVVKLARAGWAAKGVVYLLIGVLALTVAFQSFDPVGGNGGSNNQADPSGAIATVAQQPYGQPLLWVLAIGLFLYAAWRLTTVFLPADLDAKAVARRVGYAVSGVTYVLLGLAAVSLARQPGSSGGGQGQSEQSRVTEITTSVMEWTAGRWIVGLAGVVVVAIGGYFFWKGVSGSFEKQIEHRGVGPFSWSAIRNMGRAGWVGRAVMMALIGVFVVQAAIQFDPDEASGLDQSLRKIADETWGTVLIVVVALGLMLYGAFCIISSPARKLLPSDED